MAVLYIGSVPRCPHGLDYSRNHSPSLYLHHVADRHWPTSVCLGWKRESGALSGVKTRFLLFLAYVNMAFLAGVAGIVFAARLNSASPQAGQSFELDAIAACFIGGASAYGGIGTVGGTLVGAMIMGVLNNGMSIMGISSNVQQVVKGLVLLAAVAFDVISKQQIPMKLPFFTRRSTSQTRSM